MPAKSRSQQRLFGMVHAYNKGELHCSPELRRRVARIAGGISDEDARHFAETPHKGLPEKRADGLSPAVFSRDVMAGATPRVIRDADGAVQVIGPRGNVPSDALVVAEKEVSPLLAAWYARRRERTPSDADLRRMYDIVQADARLFRRLRALGLVDSGRAGRRIRNRIVHEPGYVPSEADSARAIRDYASAGRAAGRSEKRAQLAVSPGTVMNLYNKIPIRESISVFSDRSRRRRSLLASAASGMLLGALVGGVGVGAIGRLMASSVQRASDVSAEALKDRLTDAAMRCGLWGATRGAVAGAALGTGAHILGGLGR